MVEVSDVVAQQRVVPTAEGERRLRVEEVLEREDVPARIREKILTTNTLRFYDLKA